MFENQINEILKIRSQLIEQYNANAEKIDALRNEIRMYLSNQDEENYSKCLMERSELQSKNSELNTAINQLGNAIGHLDIQKHPEAFFGK